MTKQACYQIRLEVTHISSQARVEMSLMLRYAKTMVSFRWFYLIRSVVGNRFEGSLREFNVDGARQRFN